MNKTSLGKLCALTVFAVWVNGYTAVVADTPMPRYTIVDLGTVGTWLEDGYNGWSMNNQCQIVGQANGRACLWSDGKLKILDQVGDVDCHAYGINSHGQIVGHRNAGPAYHAFLWQNEKVTDLGPDGKLWGEANGINDQGVIVGSVDVLRSGNHHAVIWRNGKMQDLGTVAGTVSCAWGINDHDQVVGFSAAQHADSQRGFLWEKNYFTDLVTMPGFIDCAPVAINNQCQIVGWGFSFDDKGTHSSIGPDHAFFWERGKMHDLGTLEGGHDSHLYAINNHGQAVGWSGSSQGSKRAIVYSNGKMEDLNFLIPPGPPLYLGEALAINDHGQIVAFNGFHGIHMFLLTPIKNK